MSQKFMITFFSTIFSILEHYGLNWVFENCMKKKIPIFIFTFGLWTF